MEEIINAYMDSNGSKSSSTRSTLKQGLKRLEKIFNKDFDKLKVKDFSNSESVVDKITNLYSLNTTIGTILSIIRFLIFKESGEKIIQEYRDILNELIQERNGGTAKQEFKEGEEENWIDYEELRDKMIDDNIHEVKENQSS